MGHMSGAKMLHSLGVCPCCLLNQTNFSLDWHLKHLVAHQEQFFSSASLLMGGSALDVLCRVRACPATDKPNGQTVLVCHGNAN